MNERKILNLFKKLLKVYFFIFFLNNVITLEMKDV